MKSSRAVFLVFLIMMSLCLVGIQPVGASSEVWSQTYGGPGGESAEAMVQTSDGGYALAGYTDSFGAGGSDFWLVKTDEYGNMEWNRTYGGASFDHAYSLVETSGGGFALAGYTGSFGAEYANFWLVKTDIYGNVEWNQTYGGTGSERAYSLVETSDGGFTLAGSIHPFGADYDFWLVKTDANGNREWSRTYGGADNDNAYSLVETSDGGFALAGYTHSFGAGYQDFWLVKTDANGNMEWNQTYGGKNGGDLARSLVETSDGGFALAGDTRSYGAGYTDFWLVKTDEYGNMEWNQTYGGTGSEWAYSLVETSDGGYALAGFTGSFGAGSSDFWLVKTDEYGNMEWNMTYGGARWDSVSSLVEASDGGYALLGFTDSFGAGGSDFWLVMTDGKDVISIVSPENKTYFVNNVSLTFIVNKPASWIGYSLDDHANVTINGNRTIIGLSLGEHNLTVYAMDVAGNTAASETIHFTIAQKEPFPTLIVATIVIIAIAVVGAALLVYFRKVKKTIRKSE